MLTFSLQELSSLSNSELVIRFDQLIQQVRRERNPYYDSSFDLEPYAAPFRQTLLISEMHDINQRKAIWLAIDFILQSEYTSRYSGFKNSILDAQRYDLNGWTSPNLYINYLSQVQSSIISARIILERLMELIYFVCNQKEMPKNDSKFETFKKWLDSQPIESELVYLIPYIPWLREHDINFRTAEVHSGSKLKKYFISMTDIPSEFHNESYELYNIVINIWRYVLVLFNKQRPSGIGGIKFSHNLDWLKYYVEKDYENLKIALKP